MRSLILAFVVMALVGCGTTRLSNDVKPFVGRDIHDLISRLGNPTGRRETTGDRVYVWSVDSDGVLPSDLGREGTRTVQHECTLEVAVDAANLIRSYEVAGSDAGCAAFRRHLTR